MNPSFTSSFWFYSRTILGAHPRCPDFAVQGHLQHCQQEILLILAQEPRQNQPSPILTIFIPLFLHISTVRYCNHCQCMSVYPILWPPPYCQGGLAATQHVQPSSSSWQIVKSLMSFSISVAPLAGRNWTLKDLFWIVLKCFEMYWDVLNMHAPPCLTWIDKLQLRHGKRKAWCHDGRPSPPTRPHWETQFQNEEQEKEDKGRRCQTIYIRRNKANIGKLNQINSNYINFF